MRKLRIKHLIITTISDYAQAITKGKTRKILGADLPKEFKIASLDDIFSRKAALRKEGFFGEFSCLEIENAFDQLEAKYHNLPSIVVTREVNITTDTIKACDRNDLEYIFEPCADYNEFIFIGLNTFFSKEITDAKGCNILQDDFDISTAILPKHDAYSELKLLDRIKICTGDVVYSFHVITLADKNKASNEYYTKTYHNKEKNYTFKVTYKIITV